MRRSVAVELAIIGALALTFVATARVRSPYVDFTLAGVAIALIVASVRRSRRIWELAPAPAAPGSGPAWRFAGGFTMLALVVLAITSVAVAHVTGEPWAARFLNWHFLLAAPLYLLWGLTQQFIFQFYLLGRLLQLAPLRVAAPIAACAFAAVHFPRWPVMLATLVAGCVWSFCYFRSRRLLPLAVSHGLLGAALHYWVLDHDLLDAWLPH
ncbi:MAG TPA: CPBP family glutamic-type intramembrane protease [Gammaproteobacteria bacterium]|nr:CPBP family glutamic-type intramembrane protease [Gammaproteobacteria bacterium]